ncbi:Asp/Glu/hydantoin racemase [Hypoxylon trugodes]|uniref:Asp/Glu/hydantoin racemase n=1 Tax=Hypoxylon trugodes TaxID=326681 RepID=UPI002196B13F|nr:Asp/Glu/hydantoin racemase [Hypoxylon trugodes]KAI1394437.1 Asp/Glu/hydantoin racemase [Hypoxylon trugodes]
MPSQLVKGKTTKILVLNPNSSQAMTDGMLTVINSLDSAYSTEIHTYTGPSSAPASINDGNDLEESTKAVLADPSFLDSPFDGVVVACFSAHPLVPSLQNRERHLAVTGIFEASIQAALSLLRPSETWGIVTTGKFWEKHLTDGVKEYVGAYKVDENEKFAGVESTGLNASDFHHGVDPAVIRQKLKEATKRLLAKSEIACIVMGCAGMAGLEEIIREAAKEEMGEKFAYNELHVIDGVRAGIMQVEQQIRYHRLIPGRS